MPLSAIFFTSSSSVDFVAQLHFQACLGTNAKNERNVVNITTENMDGESVSFTILSMRLEKNEQVGLLCVSSCNVSANFHQ